MKGWRSDSCEALLTGEGLQPHSAPRHLRCLPNISRRFRKGCKYFGYGLASLLIWILLSIVFGTSLPFSRSNFILFGKLQISDLVRWVHPNKPLYWNNVRTPQGKMDCTIDFLSIFHQGGQGVLYQGICQNKHRRDSVIFKNMKKWRPLLWEGAATRVISEITSYRYYASGWNYLIASELIHYDTLKKDMPEVDDLQDFVFQQLVQVSAQIRYLNQYYFQLDVKWSNILYRPANVADTSVIHLVEESQNSERPYMRGHDSSTSSSLSSSSRSSSASVYEGGESVQLAFGTKDTIQQWQFQLIDFSMAMPRVIRAHAIKHHNDVERRRAPYVVCLKFKKSPEEKAYCNSAEVKPYLHKICDGVLDMYPLAIHALRHLHLHQGGKDVPSSPYYDPLSKILGYHNQYLQIINDLRKDENVRSDVLNFVEALIDLPHLDTELVCPGPA